MPRSRTSGRLPVCGWRSRSARLVRDVWRSVGSTDGFGPGCVFLQVARTPCVFRGSWSEMPFVLCSAHVAVLRCCGAVSLSQVALRKPWVSRLMYYICLSCICQLPFPNGTTIFSLVFAGCYYYVSMLFGLRISCVCHFHWDLPRCLDVYCLPGVKLNQSIFIQVPETIHSPLNVSSLS